MSREKVRQLRISLVLVLYVVGVILGVMSLGAELVGLDLTPGFGMVQMLQLLLGISSLTLATFVLLRNARGVNAPRSLQADVGVRLAATGLVFVYVSGLSDLIGIGTHVKPAFTRPFVGPLQLIGIALGVLSILAGMLLYHTSRGQRGASSMDFMGNGQ
ncbi:MAG: hypothetical protein ACE5FD_15860 [Anaerolineae bacterium]